MITTGGNQETIMDQLLFILYIHNLFLTKLIKTRYCNFLTIQVLSQLRTNEHLDKIEQVVSSYRNNGTSHLTTTVSKLIDVKIVSTSMKSQ